jgi:hypothetical protein
MFILSVLSETIIHFILLAGVVTTLAGFVFSFLPFISKYKFPIQILGILVLSLGIYLEGGLANEKEWQLKVAEMQVKIKDAEAKSAANNTQIQEVVVTKTEVVKEKGRDIIKYVDRIVTQEVLKEVQGPEREKIIEVVKYIENCPVPQLILEQHNAATILNKAISEKDKK